MNSPALEGARLAATQRARAAEIRAAGANLAEADALDGLAETNERMAERMCTKRPDSESPPPTEADSRRDSGMHTSPIPAAAEGRNCHEVYESCDDPIERVIVAELRRQPGVSIDSSSLAAAARTTRRTVRAKIGHLRKDHCLPIGSSAASDDDGGYFWPRRPEDLDHTLATMASRRAEIDAAVDGIREGCVRVFGTMDLFR